MPLPQKILRISSLRIDLIRVADPDPYVKIGSDPDPVSNLVGSGSGLNIKV